MDPPGSALPDSLIVAKIAQALERSWRAAGKADVADKFKGYDWKTEEDAFMDGYHQNADGGQFVTYERLRAMGTNGFQEPATGFQDGKIIGTKRLFTDGKFKTPDGKAKFAADAVARLGGAGQAGGEGEIPLPRQQRPRQPRLAVGLSRPAQRVRLGPHAVRLHPDEPGRTWPS